MSRIRLLTPALSLLIAALVALPAGSASAERASSLSSEPAVRNRLLLVKKRFEATLAFESSINSDFRHSLGGGLKLEYHLSDMWSVGAVGIASTSINTGLASRIIKTLPDTSMEGDPTPTAQQFEQHLNSMPLHGAGYVGITPWYGKLAAFGKFFVNFDFYFQGGLAMAQLQNDCCDFSTDPYPGGGIDGNGEVVSPDNDPNDDPAINDGTQFGLYFGGGIHVFINDFIALDLTVRDYMFSDNPSGLDFNADLAVTEEDNRFLNHLFMGAGISFLLPTDVKRTP